MNGIEFAESTGTEKMDVSGTAIQSPEKVNTSQHCRVLEFMHCV